MVKCVYLAPFLRTTSKHTMKKLRFLVPAILAFGLVACQSANDTEETTEDGIEQTTEEVDEVISDMEQENEDMIHDVDSLLEGI